MAADGSVIGCWATRHEQLAAGKRRGTLAPQPCEAWPTGSRKFEPGSEGGAPGDVTVSRSLHRSVR